MSASDPVIIQARDFVASLPAGERGPFDIAKRLAEFFVGQLGPLVERLGGIDAVVRIAEQAYDAYVAPLDLPGVPNLLEPQVDSALRLALGAALRAAYAQIQRGA